MPAHEFPDDDTVDGHDAVEVRRIQPYDAVKAYRCPGCNQEIRVGEGHVVVVPRARPMIDATGTTRAGSARSATRSRVGS